MTNKTYEIWGKYQGKSEKLDETNDEKNSIYLKNEYAMAYGSSWIVWIKEV